MPRRQSPRQPPLPPLTLIFDFFFVYA